MVPNHKQNVFHVRYRQGLVDYYGRKGMSFLGFMDIWWKVDGKVSEFEYSFFDYVIKRYSGPDHIQVAAVIQLAIDTVQYRHLS